MKFSFNNAIAASLHLTSLSSQPNHLAAFSSFSSNNNHNHNNKNSAASSSSYLNNVQALSPVSSAMLSSSTVLQMSVSDEERVNHVHHHYHVNGNSSGSGNGNSGQEGGEELALISALEGSIQYHPVNGNSNSNVNVNGHHQPQHHNGGMKNGVNGVNGQSAASVTTTTVTPTPTAPIIDSNGVQYKLTNGQTRTSPLTNSNGSTYTHNGQHHNHGYSNSNGHVAPTPNGNNNNSNDNMEKSTIESMVEQRVMKEVELQAQQLAEQEVELVEAQQALEQKLNGQGQGQGQDNTIDKGIEFQVEQFNAGNTDYKSSSSSYFAQGQAQVGATAAVALPEDNPLAMHIIQNTTVGGLGQPQGQKQTAVEGTTTTTTMESENLNLNDGITLDSLIETTKLSPTKLTAKELEFMEKVKEDEVVNNQAFHSALEQKVVKDVELETERIAEECTMITPPTTQEVNGPDGVTDATTVAAAAATVTVESDDVLGATNLEETTLSTKPEPQVEEQVATVTATASDSKSQESFKPFTPLPKVKASAKNGQYLDALSSNTPKSRRKKRKDNGPSGYLNELDGKNVKAVSGSGIHGYLDDITVQKNLSRGRFRIPFVGRLLNRNGNTNGNDKSGESKKESEIEFETEVQVVAPSQEEEVTVELKSEEEEDSILDVIEEIAAETDASSGTVSSSDIVDEDKPLVDDVDPVLEVPKIQMSFGVTSDILTEAPEVEVDLKEEKEEELDALVDSYINTNSSKIKVLTNTASQGNYLSYLEHKTKEERTVEPQPNDEEVPAVVGSNYLESLTDKENAATLSGDGPSNYLNQLETHQISTSKRNMKGVRSKLLKISNIAVLICFMEMKKPILSYALSAGGIATFANVITTKNPLLSLSGTLGFAMMYAGSSVGQLLPFGGVMKRAVGFAGCALLLTSNYFSKRSGNKKK